MVDSDLIELRVFTSEMEADIAKSALDAFSIECMISRDDCGGQRPHLSFSGGVRLFVRTGDAQRADEVLKGRVEETMR